MLAAARAGLVRVSAAEAHVRMRRGATLVDVRTTEQIAADGAVPGALQIGLNVLEWRMDPDSASRHRDAPQPEDDVIVLCAQGYSSSLAAARLQELGFSRATDVIGGFAAWRAAGLPVAVQ